MRLSMRWAARCREAHGDNAHALFGIVQGGAYQSLRNESADYLLGLGFDGYAIGGLAVGEEKSVMNALSPRQKKNYPRINRVT